MIALEDGSYVNSDAVLSIRWGSKGQYGGYYSVVTLKGDDNEVLRAYGRPCEIAAIVNSTIVAAAAGYELLAAARYESPKFEFFRVPIVAWKFEPKPEVAGPTRPRPLTASGMEAFRGNSLAILCPNGTVFHHEDFYKNLESWETVARRRWATIKEHNGAEFIDGETGEEII